jgi:hypothetical protein
MEQSGMSLINLNLTKKEIKSQRAKQLTKILKDSRNHLYTDIGNGKYKCECGSEFLIKHKSRHEKSQIHKDYVSLNHFYS